MGFWFIFLLVLGNIICIAVVTCVLLVFSIMRNTRYIQLQDAIKTALLLGAVDREIGGIGISGKRGTAKTIMARGLHAVLPPIDVVVGSIANADPSCPEE